MCVILKIQCPLHAYAWECGTCIGDDRGGYIHGEVGGDVEVGEGCIDIGIDYSEEIYAYHRYDAEVAVATVHLTSAVKYALQIGSVVVIKCGTFGKEVKVALR